ncbi:ATP-binding protein [Burkholderia sp. L27(2015)]|uniref:ATP-binding protein n=1 Tax=Burkholderia sp. L27(2015) TaxID=1641858 RepID=UPI00131D8243|nr:ATP-binding protein [Burkholderia sp. L27(2015)]
MHSIRRRLLVTLLATVLAGVASAGWLIYRQAQTEVNELFDYQLEQTAAALPSEPFSSVLGANQDQDGGSVVIQIWSRTGNLLYYSHPRAPLAPHAELGFSTEHTMRGDWRVYGAVVGDNVVQVAQPMSIRNELAALTAWHTLWPLLILLPVLGVLVWFVVGRGLQPLRRVTRAVDARHPDALDAMPDSGLPVEVRPLVHALNRLLKRLADGLDTQKAFVADAAHELRTPLAALNLQVQLLERAHSEQERREALGDLKQGVVRATRMVEQLLALARAEPAAGGANTAESLAAGSAGGLRVTAPSTWTEVDLKALLSECIAAYTALALHKGLDLGFPETGQAAAPVKVTGDAASLRVLFNNLVDNALKYTPAGGCIDVAVRESDGHALVEICDTGPGIPIGERARVFDRFYRGPGCVDPASDSSTDTAAGSGLGLAIVQRIANQHGASITLDEGPKGVGLRVTVRF